MIRQPLLAVLATSIVLTATALDRPTSAEPLRAGAAKVDVTPEKLPVLINGGMLSRSSEKVYGRIYARALALAAADDVVVLVTVDSCMMPRDLLDEVKERARKQCGVPPDHIAIGATHAHSVPSAFACLGTDADANYVPFLKEKLVQVICAAVANLRPARIGYASVQAPEFTALRRWVLRPDLVQLDPFGNPTVRANMHVARNKDHATGPTGPEDPELSLISVQTADGKPLALLAAFSMHYYGAPAISPDYFGLFCDQIERRLGGDSEFVAIMAHGCSGDIWRRDYFLPPDQWDPFPTIDQYARALAERALSGLSAVRYEDDVAIDARERRLPMRYRVPDRQRLEWAKRIVAAMGDRPPKTREEVYAREQIYLNQWQQTEVVVQAIRIGQIAIATTPTETYAITSLKIKAASPFPHTVVLDLTNGADGYLPPPEQHYLGGYNTWPARSAGLEVTAEPRITQAVIEMLEELAGQPRWLDRPPFGPLAKATARLRPVAWFRADEFAGPEAIDHITGRSLGTYELGVVFYLEGPEGFAASGANRAAMFAGGRLRFRLPVRNDRYSVSLWVWNGMPLGVRPIAGWFYSRGWDRGLPAYSEHLGVVGAGPRAGQLVYLAGTERGGKRYFGSGRLQRWRWHHVVLIRDGHKLRVYLDGKLDIEADDVPIVWAGLDQWFIGGRSDAASNWEGRLDEIALFDRPLTGGEVAELAGKSTAP